VKNFWNFFQFTFRNSKVKKSFEITTCRTIRKVGGKALKKTKSGVFCIFFPSRLKKERAFVI
jgi:hypothetical protein